MNECPKCGSDEIIQSCWSTHPFRVSSCLDCGYCNLVDQIRAGRAECLEYILRIPEELREPWMVEGIKNLQDPECERRLIESFDEGLWKVEP